MTKLDYKKPIWKSIEVLALACSIFRQKGYTNTSSYYSGDTENRWNNKEMLVFHFYPDLSSRNYNLSFKIENQDLEKSLEIIKYYRKLSFGVMAENIGDYKSRVFNVTQKENVGMDDFGVMASVPHAYETDKNVENIKNQIKKTEESHIGNINDSITLEIKYISTKFIPKMNCFTHNAITSTNHLVTFFNKIELGKPGSVQKIRAKIKSHRYDWHTKHPETQLNYVKVVDNDLVWQ
jgi:hypothetical protein